MLRLNILAGASWIDLVPGVRVEVLPLNTEARIRASHAITDADGKIEAERAKRDVSFLKAIARSAIIAWEGVGDANDTPLPVTPDAVDALMDVYEIYHAFHQKYFLPSLAVATEGNVSAPSPNGTTGRAKATAAGARPRARTARKSSTRPKA